MDPFWGPFFGRNKEKKKENVTPATQSQHGGSGTTLVRLAEQAYSRAFNIPFAADVGVVECKLDTTTPRDRGS